jgi:hypothetical protein
MPIIEEHCQDSTANCIQTSHMELSSSDPWLFILQEGDLMIEVFSRRGTAIWWVESVVEMADYRQSNAQNFGVALNHEEGEEKRLTRCGRSRK